MTESIGSTLKQRREARHLSIEQAAEQTRVRKYYLQALENDDLSAIPSVVQARGFLRIYTEFLGLKLDELSSAMHSTESRALPSHKPLHLRNLFRLLPHRMFPHLILNHAQVSLAACVIALRGIHRRKLLLPKRNLQLHPNQNLSLKCLFRFMCMKSCPPHRRNPPLQNQLMNLSQLPALCVLKGHRAERDPLRNP